MFRVGQFTPQLKLLFHTDRIQEWLKKGDCYPILIEVDPSNACNHHCSFCSCGYLTDKSVLDKFVIGRNVPILRDKGVRAINWSGGGEPLVNKDFCDIAVWTVRRSIEQGLFTNGVLINEDNVDVLLSTQSWIRVAIDAGTRETYKQLRGSDDFDKVIYNVKSLVEFKKKYGYNCQLGIGFVVTKENYKEIPLFADLIEKTGVDYGQYKPSILVTKDEVRWWTDEVKNLLEEVFDRQIKANINLYKLNDITNNQFDHSYPICYGHYFCPVIGADGEVYACSQLRGFKEFSFGNINRDNFDTIWKSKRRQKVIASIDVSNCPKFCKNNEINKILYHIKHPDRKTHYNFL